MEQINEAGTAVVVAEKATRKKRQNLLESLF